MKKLLKLCFLCLTVGLSHYTRAEDLSTAQPSNGVTHFISEGVIHDAIEPLIKKGFEGSIIVSNSVGTIYKKGSGFAVTDKLPYKPSTVVDIASVSKQFTAAAIMKLVENGQLATSSVISKYISDVPEDKADITIHHLLTHTAGFKRHLGRDEDKLSKDAFIEKVLALSLSFEVGERYHYSNIGYSLLAYIIEEVSGQSFESYLFKNLFEPAGMFSTGYLRPNWSHRTIPEVTRLYAGFSSPLAMLNSTEGDFWNLMGAGGIMSTAEDMALWHTALMSEAIISKKSQSLMYSPHVNENEEGYFYGYGWSIVPRDGKEPLVWHNGMSFFGTAEYWRLPNSGLMIFVASHKTEVSPWEVAHAIYSVLD